MWLHVSTLPYRLHYTSPELSTAVSAAPMAAVLQAHWQLLGIWQEDAWLCINIHKAQGKAIPRSIKHQTITTWRMTPYILNLGTGWGCEFHALAALIQVKGSRCPWGGGAQPVLTWWRKKTSLLFLGCRTPVIKLQCLDQHTPTHTHRSTRNKTMRSTKRTWIWI
jgi:hypothetical protein